METLLQKQNYREVINVYKKYKNDIKTFQNKESALRIIDSASSIIGLTDSLFRKVKQWDSLGFCQKARYAIKRIKLLEPNYEQVDSLLMFLPKGNPVYRYAGSLKNPSGTTYVELEYNFFTGWREDKLYLSKICIKLTNASRTGAVFLSSFVPIMKYFEVYKYQISTLSVDIRYDSYIHKSDFRGPIWRGETRQGIVDFKGLRQMSNNSRYDISSLFEAIVVGNDESCYFTLLDFPAAKINSLEFIRYDND